MRRKFSIAKIGEELFYRELIKMGEDDDEDKGVDAQVLFHAAREGLAKYLAYLLYSRPAYFVHLNEVVHDCDNPVVKCSPLMAAAFNGRHAVVKLLVNRYKCDVDLEGTIILHRQLIHGATALWTACGRGHLKVVKTLVRAGANVNHMTKSGSTPLRAACFEGRLDVVKYLVAHGAQVDLCNEFNNSCLMLSAYRGNVPVLSFLLESGADPNRQANCGATALHYAAEAGHLTVAEILLSSGSRWMLNNYGFTPAMHAALKCQSRSVSFLLDKAQVDIKERVDTMEVLAASLAISGCYDARESAHRHFHTAYEARDSVYDKTGPIEAVTRRYLHHKETQDISELEAIRYDPTSMQLEGFVVRERILGTEYPDFPLALIERGGAMAEGGNLKVGLGLWALALGWFWEKNAVHSVCRLLRSFTQVFNELMEHAGQVPKKTVLFILQAYTDAVDQLVVGNRKPVTVPWVLDDEDEYMKKDTLLYSALYALEIARLTFDEESTTDEEIFKFRKVVYKLVKLNPRDSRGRGLLNLACCSKTPVEFGVPRSLIEYPSLPLAMLLVECGASVNQPDEDGNTSLHLIAAYGDPIRDFENLSGIIQLLLSKGAHHDVTNKDGLSPAQFASSVNQSSSVAGVAGTLINLSAGVPRLKCLAARAYCSGRDGYNREEVNPLPDDIRYFLKLHGCPSLETTSTWPL